MQLKSCEERVVCEAPRVIILRLKRSRRTPPVLVLKARELVSDVVGEYASRDAGPSCHLRYGALQSRNFSSGLIDTRLSKLLLASIERRSCSPSRREALLIRLTSIEWRILQLHKLDIGGSFSLHRMAILVKQVNQPPIARVGALLQYDDSSTIHSPEYTVERA